MNDERGFPRSVDWFIPCGKYAALFSEAYGERPDTIQVVFPSDNAEEVCCERYEYRDDDGKLVAYGDGAEFFVWDGKKYARFLTADHPDLMAGVTRKHPTRAVRAGGDGWAVTLSLTFIVPMVRGVAGVWCFTTKGAASTIPRVRDTFDAMLEWRGFVKGVLFDLSVSFAKSQKPGTRSRFPVVSLVPNESAENVAKVKTAISENSAAISFASEKKPLSLHTEDGDTTA